MKFKALVAATILFAASSANAALLGVNSTGGVGGSIIGAPTDALDDNVINSQLQGFNEAQGVVTSVVHNTDSGSIAAGAYVPGFAYTPPAMLFKTALGALGRTSEITVVTDSAYAIATVGGRCHGEAEQGRRGPRREVQRHRAAQRLTDQVKA